MKYFAEFWSDIMVKSLSGSVASKIETCVSSAQSHAPDTFAPLSSISLLLCLKDSQSFTWTSALRHHADASKLQKNC